ncbi:MULTISPECIES: sensor domain-containing phosphodiesterase [Pseudoxanthomonas]|jgi:EAL domain-containing protein (putative c-di-GMP-specific phosphodiesterase class I)|uniref:EAL domain-containing protein n=1 Tax=Pseudoxanthomonas winnipegensis TaxID=2480810 RepID=A0A4Q8LGS5_9GAMM|nr:MULTISPECIES: EAL domain-containing protein [Pseudoxanthomonas]TAA28268.1 EAL domain-containing protein [Pseudoxanthomonas winnipegensis]TMN24887.1 EAL domain-containing protein [Pseudoxanthomonas sp. X-1]UAY73665.1 EAL domain-containing protein [Pseudoxanthomonas sp. X-1]
MVHDKSEDLIQRVLTQITSASISIDRNIEKILGVLRDHLQMDVAFVSEFGSRDRIFRHVINPVGRVVINRGDTMSMDAGYCPRVVDGRLPSLIPDTARVPEAMRLSETTDIPIGSHLSVPIQLSDGSVYGTFCCFGFAPKPTLDERDLHVMRALAQLVALQVEGDLDAVRHHNEKLARISDVLEMGQPRAVYQPIYRLHDRALIGVECLSRFDMEPKRSPDAWFNEAKEIGLGMRLEINAMLTALDGLRDMPGDFYVSVNISPQTLVAQDILDYLDVIEADRLVLELTEHALVDDYPPLQVIIERLRAAGVRFAVDDAGAGYSSMRHILTLHPDIIKMDISLTREIDRDRARQAMAAAIVGFGRQTGSHITAEGVETREELEALQSLGVDQGQGYYLSHPLGQDDLRTLLRPDTALP